MKPSLEDLFEARRERELDAIERRLDQGQDACRYVCACGRDHPCVERAHHNAHEYHCRQEVRALV